MHNSDDGGDCAHIEECRTRLKDCSAGDEETKFTSQEAKFRVDCLLTGRVESAEKSTRGGESKLNTPSGAASRSAQRQQLQHAAQQQQPINTKVMQSQIMVSRE